MGYGKTESALKEAANLTQAQHACGSFNEAASLVDRYPGCRSPGSPRCISGGSGSL